MNRIHALPTSMDGCTHIEEGLHRSRRIEAGSDSTLLDLLVELRGGIMVEGEFVPRRSGPFGQPTEWREYSVGAERASDYLAFQAEFEADDTQPFRVLEDRAHACRLEYLQRVQMGLRPL